MDNRFALGYFLLAPVYFGGLDWDEGHRLKTNFALKKNIKVNLLSPIPIPGTWGVVSGWCTSDSKAKGFGTLLVVVSGWYTFRLKGKGFWHPLVKHYPRCMIMIYESRYSMCALPKQQEICSSSSKYVDAVVKLQVHQYWKGGKLQKDSWASLKEYCDGKQ